MNMNTLALNMIVGQRPEMFLEYALLSTKWVDEKIIVNTGEKNNPNLEIIKRISPDAKILDFSETGLPFTFSNARNYALDNTSTYWVLWQDADEVHFNSFEKKFRDMAHWTHYDGFKFYFYHFLLDMFHYQHLEPRTIIFKRQGRVWSGNVHEQIQPFTNVYFEDYRYHHYGYVKPQNLIYENWRTYWKLNPDEQFKLNENRNPNDIITDRVTVAHEYIGTYPEVMLDYVKTQKSIIKDFKFI
jgi:hypothetical protein